MRAAKSINSINSQNPNSYERRPSDQLQQSATNSATTSPICRCRVMYLGSAVPHQTKDGLQGIQEPLKELYPDKATLASGNAGIDSWLSVWSNGILIENVDETGREVKRFFKIDALHYCAAVKFVGSLSNDSLDHQQVPVNLPKFLPLDSPHARQVDISNPPVFASILRRTTGIKVLECHAFICKREAAANALVRCCFHAYADTMYAKQIGADINAISMNNNQEQNNQHQPPIASKRSKSIAALNEPDDNNNTDIDSNWHKQTDSNDQHQQQRMMRRKSVNEGNYAPSNCDNYSNSDKQQIYNESLKRQQKLSKSLHQLNNRTQQQKPYNSIIDKDQVDHLHNNYNQSASGSTMNMSNGWLPQQLQNNNQVPLSQQPFYNPQAGRVPSYPPQSIIDANNGGTLKSIKSMAANSIASTLLRSKKHAKAMSMAQLNQQQQIQSFDQIISFHQPHLANNMSAATIGPAGIHSMGTMPPVPPMFLPNLPPNSMSIINGSQTMKLPNSRSMMTSLGPSGPSMLNLESMSSKEMKKLLKKTAKYGLDPSKFGENGLPPPIFPPQLIRNPHLPMAPGIPPMMFPLPPLSKSGTMVSQSAYSDVYGDGNGNGSDLMDMSMHGLQRAGLMLPPPPPPLVDPLDPNGTFQQPMKPILVKPNPEFLKSKPGKKWLKQQREFKKLLPPHLDGLPIIFGPPPPEALEPAVGSSTIIPPPPPPPPPPNFMGPPQPPVPMLDSNGYYNPHPFYGQNGRASAASTLLRYSPSTQSQLIHHHQQQQMLDNHHIQQQMNDNYRLNQQVLYSNGLIGPSPNHNQSLNMRGNHARSGQQIDQYENVSMIYGNGEYNNNKKVNNHHHHHSQRSNHSSSRNHMVEQSIISLGDENDYEDEDDEGRLEGDVSDVNDCSNQDYYSEQEVANHQRHSSRQKNNEHINNYQPSDDQSSYSSGIYKRGHINERAFSYSIRQEHKSSGPTANELVSDNDNSNYYRINNNVNNVNNPNQQAIPVNELTARLENQLNMKSFANQSRIKSHN